MNSDSLFAKKTIWRAIDVILAEVQITPAHIWGKMPTYILAQNLILNLLINSYTTVFIIYCLLLSIIIYCLFLNEGFVVDTSMFLDGFII